MVLAEKELFDRSSLVLVIIILVWGLLAVYRNKVFQFYPGNRRFPRTHPPFYFVGKPRFPLRPLPFILEDYVYINVMEENKEEREGASEGTVGSLE